MATITMIQKLRDKLGVGLRSAVELHTNYDKWEIEDLTNEELVALYNRFYPQISDTEKIFALKMEQKLKSLRAIILADATYIGLLEANSWDKFNQWMLELSPFKKPLNAYKLDEFGPLIKQFKSLRTKYDKKAMISGTEEWYHKHKLPKPSLS